MLFCHELRTIRKDTEVVSYPTGKLFEILSSGILVADEYSKNVTIHLVLRMRGGGNGLLEGKSDRLKRVKYSFP